MPNLNNKVARLTSVHQRFDTRIFIKMCSSLVANGYDVTLVVADGKNDEINITPSLYTLILLIAYLCAICLITNLL